MANGDIILPRIELTPIKGHAHRIQQRLFAIATGRTDIEHTVAYPRAKPSPRPVVNPPDRYAVLVGTGAEDLAIDPSVQDRRVLVCWTYGDVTDPTNQEHWRIGLMPRGVALGHLVMAESRYPAIAVPASRQGTRGFFAVFSRLAEVDPITMVDTSGLNKRGQIHKEPDVTGFTARELEDIAVWHNDEIPVAEMRR